MPLGFIKPMKWILTLKCPIQAKSRAFLRKSSFPLDPGKFHSAWQASTKKALLAPLGCWLCSQGPYISRNSVTAGMPSDNSRVGCCMHEPWLKSPDRLPSYRKRVHEVKSEVVSYVGWPLLGSEQWCMPMSVYMRGADRERSGAS